MTDYVSCVSQKTSSWPILRPSENQSRSYSMRKIYHSYYLYHNLGIFCLLIWYKACLFTAIFDIIFSELGSLVPVALFSESHCNILDLYVSRIFHEMSKGWVIHLLHSIIEVLLIKQVCPTVMYEAYGVIATVIAELLDDILITQPCDPYSPNDGSEELMNSLMWVLRHFSCF